MEVFGKVVYTLEPMESDGVPIPAFTFGYVNSGSKDGGELEGIGIVQSPTMQVDQYPALHLKLSDQGDKWDWFQDDGRELIVPRQIFRQIRANINEAYSAPNDIAKRNLEAIYILVRMVLGHSERSDSDPVAVAINSRFRGMFGMP